MTGSAPISFNGGAESGDRVSANTSCWFALRRRTSGRPIAPLAPAIRILIVLPFQLALRRLEARRKSCSVCHCEDSCVTVAPPDLGGSRTGASVGQRTTIARNGPIAALFSVLGENGAAELHVVYTQLTTVEG